MKITHWASLAAALLASQAAMADSSAACRAPHDARGSRCNAPAAIQAQAPSCPQGPRMKSLCLQNAQLASKPATKLVASADTSHGKP